MSMAKKIKQESKYHCVDCKHSYDYHEKNINGEFFMCKCPFHKWSKFLYRDVCEKFQKK